MLRAIALSLVADMHRAAHAQLCLFLQFIIRAEYLELSPEVNAELHSFCLANSSLRDATNLLRLLRQRDTSSTAS